MGVLQMWQDVYGQNGEKVTVERVTVERVQGEWMMGACLPRAFQQGGKDFTV